MKIFSDTDILKDKIMKLMQKVLILIGIINIITVIGNVVLQTDNTFADDILEQIEADKYKNLLPVIAEQRKFNLENPQETNFGKMEKAEYRKPVVSPNGKFVAVLVRINNKSRHLIKPDQKGTDVINIYPIDRFKNTKGAPRVDDEGKLATSFIGDLDRDKRAGYFKWVNGKIDSYGWTPTDLDNGDSSSQVMQFAGINGLGRPFRYWGSVRSELESNKLLRAFRVIGF